MDSKDTTLRKIEHLKTWVGMVIDAYKDGMAGGKGGEPMGPDMAKALIWNELHRVLQDPLPADPANFPAYLRISGKSVEHILTMLGESETINKSILSLRWLGSRGEEGGVAVAYAILRVDDLRKLATLVTAMETNDLQIRDGTFGLFVR
jgi:hypothetical protein